MVRTGTFTVALLVWTNLRQCTMCSRWLFCFLPLRLCLNGKLVSQTTEAGEWIYCIYSMRLFTPWHRRQGLQWWQKKNHRRTFFCRADRSCPAGQIYRSCSQGDDDGLQPGRGVACERTCESYLLNLTCSTQEPCVVGCACPPGWAYVKRHCMVSLSVCSHYHSTLLVFWLGL